MSDKLNTCNFRSEDQHTRRVKTCMCGSTTEFTAFYCEKRDIYPLTKEICDNCTLYEKKVAVI